MRLVHYYGMYNDDKKEDFIFLVLERCRCTLNEYLKSPDGKAALVRFEPPSANGRSVSPTANCIELMKQIAEGVHVLHEASFQFLKKRKCTILDKLSHI